MVGSNLEDCKENDLSDYVKTLTARVANDNSEAAGKKRMELIDRYSAEVAENGLDLPEYLYNIKKPVASSTPVTRDVVVADRKGCASTDISEMCENPLPENITIVVQTGGARRWSNNLVNPMIVGGN